MNSRLVLNTIKKSFTKSCLIQTALQRNSVFKPSLVSSLTRSFSLSLNTHKPAASNTNVFKELSTFLNDEIKLEKETDKHKSGLPKITGFAVKTDGPNVTLIKSHEGEEITVKFNVNGSLNNMDQEVEAEKPETDSELKARPIFIIDIKKNNQVLSFSCDFLPAEDQAADSKEPPVEDFQINEFAIHSGDWNENVYTADCSVLDGLYDILLNLLDERGVGEQFANELVNFATSYEHSQYVGLLEKLKNLSV